MSRLLLLLSEDAPAGLVGAAAIALAGDTVSGSGTAGLVADGVLTLADDAASGAGSTGVIRIGNQIIWTDVVAYSSALAAVDPIVQSDLLAYVNTRFAAVFGGENSPTTRLARIYVAAHFASLPGAGEQRAAGAVISQTRGPVSQSFAPPPTGSGDDTWSDTQWGRRYKQLLAGSRARWPRTP